MKYSTYIQRHKTEAGQTLILAVMILIIIAACALLFFDLHNAIRGKVKGQNAVDAAALAGANWQRHTLNLIGELNLLKAAEVLISGTNPGMGKNPDTFLKAKSPEELEAQARLLLAQQHKKITPEALKDALQVVTYTELARLDRNRKNLTDELAILTQMQARISFVGPLIGMGAAETAAKNNGLAANLESGQFIYEYLFQTDGVQDMYQNEQIAPQLIQDYAWRNPYMNMLSALLDAQDSRHVYGVAAFPKFNFLGTPDVSAKSGSKFARFLMSRDFFDAVMGDNWCDLMDFLDLADVSDMTGAWWGDFSCNYDSTFIGESELLPVHMEFFTGEAPYKQAAKQGTLTGFMQNRNTQDILPDYDKVDAYTKDNMKWDAVGRPVVNSGDTDLRMVLPEITWALYDDSWKEYSADTINSWSDYLSGDIKKGTAYSGAVAYFESAQSIQNYKGGGQAFTSFKDVGGSTKGYGELAANRGERLKEQTSAFENTATAKPIGSIKVQGSETLTPFGAGRLILPVFSHAVLTPVALDPTDGFSAMDLGWIYFVTEFLPLLGQSGSVQTAWANYSNSEHADSVKPFVDAIRDKLNSQSWREKGLNWLNEPTSYYEENGHRKVKGRRRDRCNYWPSGGSGGRRYGPSILH